MLKFFGTLALSAWLVFSAKPVEAQATATATPISADDTASYINATLHKYPALEFVNSGCPGYEQIVSISEDRRSLNIQQNVGRALDGTCNKVETVTVPIFSLNLVPLGTWSRQGQHSSFILDCTNRVSCFSYRADMHSYAKSENQWFLHVTAPDLVSNRLQKAIHHLVDALLTEAALRAGPNDSLPKSSH